MDKGVRFEIFWRLYPQRNGRKMGKIETAELFAKLSADDQLLCCRAAGAYAQYYKNPTNPGEFRPEPRDPVRFLKKDWWRDWLVPETKHCRYVGCRGLCKELAAPGSNYCEPHGTETEKYHKVRERHGVPQPRLL